MNGRKRLILMRLSTLSKHELLASVQALNDWSFKDSWWKLNELTAIVHNCMRTGSSTGYTKIGFRVYGK
jgi:hypothetical protein